MKLYQTIFGKAHSEAVYKTRWVTTRFPNAASAQEANMSTEAYEKFYYDVCTLDYNNMSKAMEPLKINGKDKTSEDYWRRNGFGVFH